MKVRAHLGACIALGTALTACDKEPIKWRIRFENRADAMATQVVEARVRRGTCDGEIVWEGRAAQGQAFAGMGIPQLPDGLYALEAVARDASCRTLARECILAAAPLAGSISLELPSRPAEAACAAAFCVDGSCIEGDAGVFDAGAPDAGAIDVGAPDAQMAPPDAFLAEDAGPPDAFIVPDAFITPPPAPVVIAPWNGVLTGAPIETPPGLADPPRRPLFIWERASGVGSYRIELTRCDLPVWTDCIGRAPDYVENVEVEPGGLDRVRLSTDLPVSSNGARYVFRIGACATSDQRGCAYSAPRYLDVGRTWGDMDGDGSADLLGIARSGSEHRVVEVGLDAMAVTRLMATSTLSSLVAIGDYDGDGVGEMIARTPSTMGGRWVYLDDYAIGGVVEETTPGAGMGTRIVPVGDMNADGFADFAVTLPGANLVRVQLGQSAFEDFRLDLPAPSAVSAFGFDLCGAGDVNLDGRPDLAVAMMLDSTTVEVRYYSILTDGRLRPSVPSVAPIRVSSGAVGPIIDGLPTLRLSCGADVDGNGRPETLFGRFRVSEVLIRGDASLAQSDANSLGATIAWGDLDGVGLHRILAARPGFPRGMLNGTAVIRVDTGRMVTLSDFDTSAGLIQANSDFDGDGRDDVLFTQGSDMRAVLRDRVLVVPPPAGTSWLSMGTQ